VVVFSMNEPIQLSKMGYNINSIEFSDYLDYVSAGIVTNDEQIASDPELIRDFIAATKQGIEDIKADSKSNFDIVADYLELSTEQRETQYAVLLKTSEFWNEITINEETWEKTVMTLDSFDLIENQKKIADFVDASFTN